MKLTFCCKILIEKKSFLMENSAVKTKRHVLNGLLLLVPLRVCWGKTKLMDFCLLMADFSEKIPPFANSVRKWRNSWTKFSYLFNLHCALSLYYVVLLSSPTFLSLKEYWRKGWPALCGSVWRVVWNTTGEVHLLPRLLRLWLLIAKLFRHLCWLLWS